jgi:hypothetical protein
MADYDAKWFRSWHGAPTDPKWLVVARRAQVAPGVVSAVFWALMDYASQHTDRGSVKDFDVETYAAFTGWEESEIIAVLAAMTNKGIITPDDRLAAWDKRQPKKEDPTATERQQRKRERDKLAERDNVVTDDDVTQDNATVTPCHAVSHSVTTDKIREDKIREEKTREEEIRVSPPVAAPAKPARVVTPGSQQDMFGAIADTCQLDAKLKTGQIAKQAKALLEAGYTPAQVRSFPAWWQSHDWRGQRGNVPTLAQLAELIKQSTTNTNGTDPGKKREVNRFDRILGVDIHGNPV